VGELAKALRKADRRILILDIETAPNMAAVWQQKTGFVSWKNFVEDQRVLCFAAKWVGESKVLFASEHHDGRQTMLEKAHDLVTAADILVGYNSKKFDWRHLKTEWLLEGFDPPLPVQHSDLYVTAKREFNLASYSLDHLAARLGLGRKKHHPGIDMWFGCMAGDDASWRNMRRYNVGDVRLTEDVWTHLSAWDSDRPHVTKSASAEVPTCNKCGSTDLARAGTYTAKVLTYQMYRCNVCQGLSRAGHRLSRVGHTVGVK